MKMNTETSQKTDSAQKLGVAAGSAPITTERKMMLLASALCVAVFCGCMIAIAFKLHVIGGLAVTAIVAWWIGSSIAEVLKESAAKEAKAKEPNPWGFGDQP